MDNVITSQAIRETGPVPPFGDSEPVSQRCGELGVAHQEVAELPRIAGVQ